MSYGADRARRWLLSAVLLSCVGSPAVAAKACHELVKQQELPPDFKLVSRSAIGPAKFEIRSNGECTCNSLPAAQRSLGEGQPDGINWACDKAEIEDSKAK